MKTPPATCTPVAILQAQPTPPTPLARDLLVENRPGPFKPRQRFQQSRHAAESRVSFGPKDGLSSTERLLELAGQVLTAETLEDLAL